MPNGHKVGIVDACSNKIDADLVTARSPPWCSAPKELPPMHVLRLVFLVCAVAFATPCLAARCGGDFNTFVAAMSAEAQAAGISQGGVSQALAGGTQDPAVVNFDPRPRRTVHK